MAKAGKFKSYFFRGLAVLLPTVLTIWIILWGYEFISNTISVPIKQGISLSIKLAGGSDEVLEKFWVDKLLSAVGFVVALGIVIVVGALLASVLGKAIWRQVEKFIMNTPLLKLLYPYIKQITDFFLSQDKTKKMFSSVVAVEYPRKGVWSVGFVTGSGLKKVTNIAKKEFVTIFIATTPSPLTGFTIIVPKEEVIDLDMTIEEAFGFIVSAGLVVPSDKQRSEKLQGGASVA